MVWAWTIEAKCTFCWTMTKAFNLHTGYISNSILAYPRMLMILGIKFHVSLIVLNSMKFIFCIGLSERRATNGVVDKAIFCVCAFPICSAGSVNLDHVVRSRI